jgi:hypothetical protein
MISCDHLIIVAGPSCVGKSALIENIEGSRLARELSIESNDDLFCVDVIQLSKLKEGSFKNLIFHYEFMQYDFILEKHNYQSMLANLIKQSRKVSVITLYASSKDLAGRLLARKKELMNYRDNNEANADIDARIKLLNKKLGAFSDVPNLITIYNVWLGYVDRIRPESHFFCKSMNNERVFFMDDETTRNRLIDTIKA